MCFRRVTRSLKDKLEGLRRTTPRQSSTGSVKVPPKRPLAAANAQTGSVAEPAETVRPSPIPSESMHFPLDPLQAQESEMEYNLPSRSNSSNSKGSRSASISSTSSSTSMKRARAQTGSKVAAKRHKDTRYIIMCIKYATASVVVPHNFLLNL